MCHAFPWLLYVMPVPVCRAGICLHRIVPNVLPEYLMKPYSRPVRPARLLASLIVSGSLLIGVAHAQQSDDVPDEVESGKSVYPAQELTPQIL